MRRPDAGLGLLVYFALVGLVYAMASPYGAPPDEPTHYVKALATAGGDLVGRDAAYPGERSGRQRVYVDSVTRRFRVPERLTPPTDDGDLCFILDASQSAACPHRAEGGPERLSYVGVYPPLPYLAPGLAARLGTGKDSGLLAARLASGVVALLLIAVAVAALRHPGCRSMSLLGVAMVMWPGMLFLAWGLNPNGTEIVAALAFYAALLALTREGTPPRWLWAAAAAAGFLLCTSRPLAPVWAFFGLVMAVVLVGPREAVTRARSAGRPAIVVIGAIAVGTVTTLVWDVVMSEGRPPDDVPWSRLVTPALESIPGWVRDMVGRLGWSEVILADPVYDAWSVLLIAVALVALAVGNWRERLACMVTSAVLVATTVAFFVLTHPSGFPMGARYVQAGMTGLVLLCVEVVFRNREKLPRLAVPALVGVVVLLAAATQLDALYRNGRRFAVGVDGPAGYLFGGSEWQPPGGWWPWTACAVAGSAALVAGFVGGLRRFAAAKDEHG